MLKKIASLVLLLLLSFHGSSQSMKEHVDRLFFNIYTAKPDSSVTQFLRLYIPSLTKQPVLGKWINHPASDTVIINREMHSFLFTKHPFIKEKITSGRLDFTCRRYGTTNSKQNITGLRLFFEFDTDRDCEIVFSKLVETFIPLATDKKIGTVRNMLRAEFINVRDKSIYGRVKLSSTADGVSTHPYKVVFELGNDLAY